MYMSTASDEIIEYLSWVLFYLVYFIYILLEMCLGITKKSQLHIGCWNINGHKNKGFDKYSDPRFINEICNKDIVCLIETHCSLEESLSLDGFKPVHLIRPKSKGTYKRSGGISVFVKSELRPGVNFLEHENNDYIWLQLCRDFFGMKDDIYLCYVYNPPDNSSYTKSLDEDIFELIEKDISKFSDSGKILIAGDLNARTGSQVLDFINDDQLLDKIPGFENFSPDQNLLVRYSMDEVLTTRGKNLNEICIQSGLRILNGRVQGDFIGQLTCFTPNGSSVVDYFISSESLMENISFFKVHKFFGELSDHCQISVMLKIDCRINNNINDKLQFAPSTYIWNETSSQEFITALSSDNIQSKINDFNNKTYDNVDILVADLNSIITEVADKSLKQKQPKKKNSKHLNKRKQPKWFDMSLTCLRRQLDSKEKLLKKYSKDPVVRTSYFSLLKLYRKSRKHKLKEFRQSVMNELDNLHDNNPNKYWDLLKELSKDNNKSSSPDIPSNTWFEYFKDLNKSKVNTPNDNFVNNFKQMEKEKIFSELDFQINDQEIITAICTLKNKKSSGFDMILNEMLKCSQSFLLNSLKKVFNHILVTGSFPNLWAKGFIVPIFKSGPTHDPSNYRGITIGSSLGKLFAKILNTRLETFLSKRNIICKEQIGFCKKKRTSDHMFVLKTLIEKYTQKGHKLLFSCFVDFRRAFDTVWHMGLFYKLRKYGISDLYYNVIKNMYKKTELNVRIDKSHMTDSFASNIGVRQGDNLSPNLFKLFINDLPEIFDNTCDPVQLDSIKLNCLLYADDVVLLSETAEGLQKCLDKLSQYSKKWGLEVNLKKTKSLVFNGTGRLNHSNFYFNNCPIDKVRQYTYLGINFSASGSFTDAKHDLYKRGLKALFKIYKIFKNHKPKIKTLLHVFDHTVKPILTYGSEIWGAFDSKKLTDKGDCYFEKICKELQIELIHTKICKFSLGVGKRSSNMAVIGELGRYPLFIEIIVNMFLYLSRLEKTEDKLLSEALSVSKALSNQNKKSWYNFMSSLSKYLDTDLFKIFNMKFNLKKFILNRLKLKYNQLWYSSLNDDRKSMSFGNKLRTYRLFKNNISFEPYLSMGNRNLRIQMTKFRISNHNLEIERGRYRGLQATDRICNLCKNGVEDEPHFLLKCKSLENERESILSNIVKTFKNFKNLDIHSQFIWLMSNEDNYILNQVCNLINNLNTVRKQILET